LVWNSSFYMINKASIALRRWNPLIKEFTFRAPSVTLSTGEFVKAPARTLRGRLGALAEWKQTVIQKAMTGEHIIRLRDGLYLDMCWAHFWTTVGVGVSSVCVVGYTAIESCVVVTGSSIALVTSPVWGLLGSIGCGLFNALVYDRDLDLGDQSKGPLCRNVFGLHNVVASTLKGTFHFLKGAGCAVGGGLRFSWNVLWHGLMTTVLRRAEVPTRAEGFFWSTSGPGMKNPFILIDADTTSLALLVFLSEHELSA